MFLLEAPGEICFVAFSSFSSSLHSLTCGTSFRLQSILHPSLLLLSNLFLSMLTLLKVKSESCSVMSNSVTPCSPPGSSVHVILQARIREWVAIPFSRGSSQPRDWTQVSCIAGRFFTIWVMRVALDPLAAFLIRLLWLVFVICVYLHTRINLSLNPFSPHMSEL